MQRAYYSCTNKDCKHTEHPLDGILNLSRGRANAIFKQMICFFSAQMPYDRVQECLRLFWSASISQTMIRETAQGRGLALIQAEEKLAQELEEGCMDNIPPPPIEKKPEELYIQVDGAMVPICPEKGKEKGVQYRENKLAVLFDKKDMQPCRDARRPNVSYKIALKSVL